MTNTPLAPAKEWICAPCALLFERPETGGFALGEQGVECPQCGAAALPAGGGVTCPQATDDEVTTRYDLGPQLFAGTMSGLTLGAVFVGLQLGVAWLLAWTAGSWAHGVVVGGNGLFLGLWAFVNVSGLAKPG